MTPTSPRIGSGTKCVTHTLSSRSSATAWRMSPCAWGSSACKVASRCRGAIQRCGCDGVQPACRNVRMVAAIGPAASCQARGRVSGARASRVTLHALVSSDRLSARFHNSSHKRICSFCICTVGSRPRRRSTVVNVHDCMPAEPATRRADLCTALSW